MNQRPTGRACINWMARHFLRGRRRRTPDKLILDNRLLDLFHCLREKPRTTRQDAGERACMTVRERKTSNIVKTRKRIRGRYTGFRWPRDANDLSLSSLIPSSNLTPCFVKVDLQGRWPLTERVQLITALLAFFGVAPGRNNVEIIPCRCAASTRFLRPVGVLCAGRSYRSRVANGTQRIIWCISNLRRWQRRYRGGFLGRSRRSRKRLSARYDGGLIQRKVAAQRKIFRRKAA